MLFFVCVMTGGGIHGAWGLRLIHLWTYEDPSVRFHLGSSHVTSHHTGWIWAREVFHGRAGKKTDIKELELQILSHTVDFDVVVVC